jgi:hypothetical protein
MSLTSSMCFYFAGTQKQMPNLSKNTFDRFHVKIEPKDWEYNKSKGASR